MITIDIGWVLAFFVTLYMIWKFWKKILKLLIIVSVTSFLYIVYQVKQKFDVVFSKQTSYLELKSLDD